MMLQRIIAYCCFAVALFYVPMANSASPDEAFRILHVMSYHSSWKWNREQLQGFKSALSDIEAEYKVVELDTKQQSDEATIRVKAETADQIIREWKPHLLYANDDNAQEYVSQRYVGSDLPIVFSAVNRDPSEYNFLGAENVTGVVEHEHFIPTVNLLRQIVPEVKRIAVIVDSDPTWKGVMGRMRSNLRQIPDIEITDWALLKTFAEFQEKIQALQNSVDAIAMLGVFNIKDEDGNDIDYEIIQRWMVDNSSLPDFSFWQTRVERGTLCAVAVSGYEQGYLAGQMARQILVDGVPPSSIPMRPSAKGHPMISLARARKLGLNVDVNLLLNAETLTQFAWED